MPSGPFTVSFLTLQRKTAGTVIQGCWLSGHPRGEISYSLRPLAKEFLSCWPLVPGPGRSAALQAMNQGRGQGSC
ncbi:hypothetical protein VTN31DRAFT_1967 [Thermomyces dupontii]|uniref:uncharacterized protein n=1 Tax=Talaromyces thermophilus TaxID=28565 RepID=UPI0037422D9C